MWDLLEFGDGYVALSLGGVPSEDDSGEKVVDFLIRPSPLLRKRYRIPDSLLSEDFSMRYRVKEKDLIPINMFDAANRRWLYIKNFNHEETELTKWGWKLRKENEMLRDRIMTLEGENMWLLEQLQLAKTNPREFLAQGAEIFEAVTQKMGDMFLKDRNKPESSAFQTS